MKTTFQQENLNAYNEDKIAEVYSKESHLQRPESTIFNLMKGRLSEIKMLDMGVGGGRTTVHFGKAVKQYVGIDYAESMITRCQQRFLSEDQNNLSFAVCDARDMKMFKDNEFDFILFSFNGIDYIPHADRIKTLEEIRRIGKDGAYFCFSTHNIKSINRTFSFHDRRPGLKGLARWFLLNFVFNSPNDLKKVKASASVIINDGAQKFKLKTFYIDPIYQVQQLTELSFMDIRVFSLVDGAEIKGDDWANCTDTWVYFLCTIKK